MERIAAFGEIMLKLTPPGRERFFQSPVLKTSFGGAEANVVVSLARFGHEVKFISVVPENDAGEAALAELKKYGVGTDSVVKKGRRLGIYFAETGAVHRPARVLYDRDHSALAEAAPGDIDWDRALEGVSWLHMTGITPALSPAAAALAREALETAVANGMTVSLDLNYRSKLWKYGREANDVMPELVRLSTILIANEEDFQRALGMGGGTLADVEKGKVDIRRFEEITAEALEKYVRLSRVAVTLRESRSADHNVWSAVLRNKHEFIIGPNYDIGNIVDRVGSGDAFAAGLIHGILAFGEDKRALDFAVAASCLKHSIPGDFNLVTEKDVLSLLEGEGLGRIQR